MRVVVTGVSGFIGSHLCRELQDAGHLVSGISKTHDGDLPGAIKSHGAEVLIHLEGENSGLLGETNVYETVGDTAGVTAEVAKACGRLGVRFIYASTDAIYGDTNGAVSDEEGPFGMPNSTYALSKLMGESLGLLYAPKGLTILRISSPYGPGLEPNKSAIINLLLQAHFGMPMPVHIGAERSWCWIGDIVRGIRLVMENSDGVYNIGRGDGFSMQEVAELACSLTGADKSLIEEVAAPAGQTVVRRLSVQKLRRLGWDPRVSLYEGMKMTLDGWVKLLDETGELPVPHLVSQ